MDASQRLKIIPALDLASQYAAHEDEIDDAIKHVLRGGSFILGETVASFERNLASYCGVRFALGVGSGSDALRLALLACGIGPGDEVITTPFSYVATATSISHCGATPVFVDIDLETFNLDPELVRKAITQHTKAILPVHLFGLPANLDALQSIAEEHNLLLIEDCAQAIGAHYNQQVVGSFGAVGCLSFYPTKNLGCAGDGGAVLTNDPVLAERTDLLRQLGCRQRYRAEVLGFNSRLDALQAAILQVKLAYLDDWNRRRNKIAAHYRELLAGLPLVLPDKPHDRSHVYHQFTLRAQERDALLIFLHDHAIAATVYYPEPLHQQPLYKNLGYMQVRLPKAELACHEVISLPIYPELSDDQVETVAETVRYFYEHS